MLQGRREQKVTCIHTHWKIRERKIKNERNIAQEVKVNKKLFRYAREKLSGEDSKFTCKTW